MNVREQTVKKLIKQKINWVVGGYENAVSDKHIEEMPSREQIADEVYQEVIDSKYLEIGAGLMPIQKDIRFLGKQRIKQLIKENLK